MKTEIFLKSYNNQLDYQSSTKKDIQIELLANWYESETGHTIIPDSDPVVYYDERIYKVTSRLYDKTDLLEKFSSLGDEINAIEAQLRVMLLQPIREVEGIDGPETIDKTLIDLPEAKVIRENELKVKSFTLCSKGFNKTVNSKDEKFGSSQMDQNNWNSFLNRKDKKDYPVSDEIKNWDGEYVTVLNAVEAESIYEVGEIMVNGYRKSHATLLVSIKNCSTIKEVYDIIDDRS